MAENFPKLKTYQITDPGSTQNTSWIIAKKSTAKHIIFKLQEIKDEKIFKKTDEKT